MTDSAAESTAWITAPDKYLAAHPPAYGPDRQTTSCYIGMRDGIRIALDVHLPADLPDGARLPALAIFTPYYRRFKLKPAAPPGTEASPNAGYLRDFFTPHGYAVVVADVRGTGASFGVRDGFRSPAEREDYREIADWIADRPWCDGNIGSTGISYVGAAADFLATTGHPAVKAVIPTYAVWDTYADHFYPGGLLLNFLGPEYNKLMEGLDRDDREVLANFAYFSDPNLDGPAPVDDDPDGELLARAIAGHAGNVDVTDFVREFRYRDTPLSYDPDYTAPMIGPAYYADSIDPRTAYYSVSGWMDGCYFPNAAVRRYLSLKNANKHLVMGPWDHGARTNASPFRNSETPEFERLAEYLRFFDHYLKGLETGLDDEAPVHYFTMVEEAWKSAESWPPPEAETATYYFAADGTLSETAPATVDAADEYLADYTCGSGTETRFERLAAEGVVDYYADWHGRDATMLTYTTEPLLGDVELAGHPVATLHVSSSEKDGAFHVYIEDVAPDGTCRYVTEGVLRALHRQVVEAPWNLQVVGPYHSLDEEDAAPLTPGEPAELAFSLIPTAWLFREGHRIRVAVAAVDRDHFSRVPAGRRPVLSFHRGRDRASRIELPLIQR